MTKKPARNANGSRRIGLARALSKAGVCSRSQAGRLIREGRVRLNGAVKRDAEAPVNLNRDRIEVDREPIGKADAIYLMLNKPRGIVTTRADERGRNTVYSLLGEGVPWLAPVGRLDKASEGLLLFSNDSEWAARITAPESHVQKVYHVQVDSQVEESVIDRMKRGVRAEGGDFLRVTDVQILRRGERNCWLSIVLSEGKNRHVRRLIEALGIGVRRLVRVSIGPLELGDLPKGQNRPLTADEKHALDRAIRHLS